MKAAAQAAAVKIGLIMDIYRDVSFRAGKVFTRRYSTSFSVGVRCLDKSIRDAVYGIYGFVRLADEIVDSFQQYDSRALFEDFEREYRSSLRRGISTNPVINAFRDTMERYRIDESLPDAFLRSMRFDLEPQVYGEKEVKEYIYGSAEVVGLMCLKVFVGGNDREYERLRPYAVRLGAAFQKVNFLRDLKHDTQNLHRLYFPELHDAPLCEESKNRILSGIYDDFDEAETGIRLLPSCARLGVYTAYLYYTALTKVIERTPAERLVQERVRVSNSRKALLLGRAYFTEKFI